MKLSFRDLMIVVQEAVSLITGDVGTGGAVTRTTIYLKTGI